MGVSSSSSEISEISRLELHQLVNRTVLSDWLYIHVSSSSS